MNKIFSIHNLFSLASREQCMANLKKIKVPQLMKNPITTEPNAAILVPVCTVNNVTSLLYTIRSPNLRSHSSQVCFPGGKLEEGETAINTALRETQEEIGLSPTRVDIWGSGNPIPGKNSKTLMTPVVGTILDLCKEDLTVNTKEVSEVFAVPLEILCDPKNQFYTQFRNGHVLPVFVAEDYKIWGITAFVTHTFLSCLLPKDVYKNDWKKKKIEMPVTCKDNMEA